MNSYTIIASLSILLWVMASFLINKKQKRNYVKLANIFYISGLVLLIGFILKTWIEISRPPMRTLGETRLWYGIFLPLIGYISYCKWKYKWLLYYCFGLGIIFLSINLIKPENFDKNLMPALQSPWFVPHVVVYMIAYALLGVSSLLSIKGLYLMKKNKFDTTILNRADNLVYMGLSMLTLGLLFGALWAKIAWGDYWAWDPKETWALLTWLVYLIYIHFRHKEFTKHKTALIILSISYCILLICWFGLNYMSSGANSVHTYTR